MKELRKIALFGGTFDPVHLGHIHLATLAQAELELDEVRFLPCRISPHKSATLPATPKDRCEMLKLATSGLPWAVVDDHEILRGSPSYSYQTAEVMKARFPYSSLFWIMGGDQWDALPRWEKPETLAKLVTFIVLARGSKPEPRDGYRLQVIDGSHPASATEIRNKKGDSAWLAPAVKDYISRRGLYAEPPQPHES